MKSRLGRILLAILLCLTLAVGSSAALADSLVLSGVPDYLWDYGCSPTSGGMLMGYWAEHGYAGLLPGVSDPMVQSQAVNDIISSPAHNANETWQGHPADCIADFMHTVSGRTTGMNIKYGLEGWTTYVGLDAQVSYSSVQSGNFNYTAYKNEIDAGRPVLLNLTTVVPGDSTGHTVLAYGYQDSMFQLRIPTQTGYLNVTVPGFAVMDTWHNGGGPGTNAEWKDWNGDPVYSIIVNGVEWWPFLDVSLTSGNDYYDISDWEIYSGVFYDLVADHAPVPPTLVLLGSGLLLLLGRRLKMG
jgi:hypothetical protein